MLKYILFFLLLINYLFSFETRVNFFKENSLGYEVLHIINDEEFSCQEIFREDKTFYICDMGFETSTKIPPKLSKFFDIRFITEKEFKVYIYSKHKSKVFSINYELFNENELTTFKKENSKHWIFISSSINIESNKDRGIAFPIQYNQLKHPYIGTLDSNSEPVGTFSKAVDIKKYLYIKSMFLKNKFEKVIQEVKRYEKDFSQTLFGSELSYYKLVATSKLMDENIEDLKDDLTSVIKEAKAWLKENPSSPNYTEILYIVAKMYHKIVQNVDANYFIDILLSEHEHDKFSDLANILKADIWAFKEKMDKANKIYKEVLYKTKHIEVASKSAMILTLNSIKKGDSSSAKIYFSKLLYSDNKYLLKNKYDSYQTAKLLAKNYLFELAAKFGEKILKKTVKKDEIYDDLLFNIGLWWYKSDDYKNAYTFLSLYLEKLEYGEHVDEVRQLLDIVLFDLDENNSTKRMNYLDNVLNKYEEEKILKRAKEEKLLLYYKMKNDADVLTYAKNITLNDKLKRLVNKSANNELLEALKSKKCRRVIKLKKDYNITIEDNNKKLLYLCYKEYGLTSSQKQIINNSLKDGDNNLFYLNEYVNILYNQGNFKEAKVILDDMISLEIFEKSKKSYNTNILLAKVLIKLNSYNELIKILQQFKTKDNIKVLDIYYSTMLLASKKEDVQGVRRYAMKIMKIQKKLNLKNYSPKVEFTLIEALKKLNQFKEALIIVKNVLNLKTLSENNKLRAYYNASEIYLRLKKSKEARRYLEKCIKVKSNSSWMTLCKNSLDLL